MQRTAVDQRILAFGAGVLLAVVADASTDWPRSAETIERVGSLGTFLAASYAAWIAYQGLRAWRQQLHGTEGFKIGCRFLRCLLRYRDAICLFRTAQPDPAEGRVALKRRGEPIPEPTHDGDLVAIKAADDERWRDVGKALMRLQTASRDVEVLLGPKAEAVTGALRAFWWRMRRARESPLSRPGAGSSHGMALHQDTHDADNEFTRELKAAIEAAEQLVDSLVPDRRRPLQP